MIIGITGNFGSGKTTVSEMFKEYGFKIINVDKLYHGIYNNDLNLKNKIKKEFKTTKRSELKKIVFNDDKRLRRLNQLTHPIIIKEIKEKIKKTNPKKNNIIIDAPLLLESDAKRLVDKVIVVKTTKSNSIKRISKKKRYSLNEIEKITRSQLPIKEKLRHADFVVDNNKDLKSTKKQVENISKIIISKNSKLFK